MEEKKPYCRKKILFIISLVPYVVFGVWGMINCVICSVDRRYLDLYALIEPVADFWVDTIIDLNPFFIALLLFAIAYPIYYLLDIGGKRKRFPEKMSNKLKIDKLFVLYLVSYIPYLYIVWCTIFGVEFGFFYNSSIYYGFGAMALAFMIGSVIAVYPICIIFQLVFTLKKYKVFSEGQKKLIKILWIVLLLLLLVPSLLYALIG